MANTFNIQTVRGDTWPGFSTTITRNSSALNLTGATVRMQLKKSAGDSCYQLEFSSLSTLENVITITEPLSGKFTVEPEIITLTPREYIYDTQVMLGDGEVITILKGTFTVEQDITT